MKAQNAPCSVTPRNGRGKQGFRSLPARPVSSQTECALLLLTSLATRCNSSLTLRDAEPSDDGLPGRSERVQAPRGGRASLCQPHGRAGPASRAQSSSGWCFCFLYGASFLLLGLLPDPQHRLLVRGGGGPAKRTQARRRSGGPTRRSGSPHRAFSRHDTNHTDSLLLLSLQGLPISHGSCLHRSVMTATRPPMKAVFSQLLQISERETSFSL